MALSARRAGLVPSPSRRQEEGGSLDALAAAARRTAADEHGGDHPRCGLVLSGPENTRVPARPRHLCDRQRHFHHLHHAAAVTLRRAHDGPPAHPSRRPNTPARRGRGLDRAERGPRVLNSLADVNNATEGQPLSVECKPGHRSPRPCGFLRHRARDRGGHEARLGSHVGRVGRYDRAAAPHMRVDTRSSRAVAVVARSNTPASGVENFAWLPVGLIQSKLKFSSVSLIQARPQVGLFFGVSTLVRK